MTRMVIYSLGLMLLEERALFGQSAASKQVLEYADWMLGAAQKLLATGRPGAT
ncbi:MAG TPA: hypothetical protein VGP93_13705 [Polyangiaceae bacterium]|nr:hypothetical protein [Polyangiaceae bacterium]